VITYIKLLLFYNIINTRDTMWSLPILLGVITLLAIAQAQNCGQFSSQKTLCLSQSGCWYCTSKEINSQNTFGTCRTLFNNYTCGNVATANYCGTCVDYSCGSSVSKVCNTPSPSSKTNIGAITLLLAAVVIL
jgi:hypothetical protein